MIPVRARLLLLVLLQAAGLVGCHAPRPLPSGPGWVGLVDPLIGTGVSIRKSTRRHSEAPNEALGQTIPAVGHPFGLTYQGEGRHAGFSGHFVVRFDRPCSAGAPWKTQHRVRELMRAEYDASPAGLSGNDDAGQMSAWYVFSALGFYPAAPGLPHYVLGTPLFPEATLRLPDGRRFTIAAPNVSAENRYIRSARLNGAPFERPWIAHAEIVAGGTLEREMGAEPNRDWGSAVESAPPSVSGAVPRSSGASP